MSNIQKRLEVLANAAIVVVAILAIAVAGYQIFGKKNAGPPELAELKAGTQVDVAGVDWRANKKTLVLVLQKGCHFCTDSAPFYKRLTAALDGGGIKPVAVLPGSPEDSKSYLESLGVSIADIRSAGLSSLRVSGTPTLLLVDEEGKLEASWTGKLDASGEEEVLQKLDTATAPREK